MADDIGSSSSLEVPPDACKEMGSLSSIEGPPDFSIVLVGSQRYGADSAANTILGGDTFEWGRRTANSVSYRGEVNGKTIQLVKAPVWLRGYHLCDTPELIKEELILCVRRCDPAPHAFILLVEVDFPFTTACARAVDAHLELYGKNVWSHTLVLFTCVDWLRSTTIDQYITGEGDGLVQLLQKCGGRFYTFDNTKTCKTLSEGLLGKIEEMVKDNGGKHFEIEQNVLQHIDQKREEVTIKAKDRRQKMEKRTEENKAGTSSSELTVIMLGWVFAVKTGVGNAILSIPDTQGRTEQCVKRSTVVGERKVTVVDTPGWWKFLSANLVPSIVKSEIMKAFDHDQAGTQQAKESTGDQASSNTAFLLMLPVDTSFTNEQRKIVEDNMKPLGENVWQNTIVVFARSAWLGKYSIEQHIESEGDALIWLVEKCGNRYFAFDDRKQQNDSQVTGLLNMIEEMLCMSQSLKTISTAETRYHTEAATSEEEVDEDLKRMAGVLHKVWGWRPWEIQEIRKRLSRKRLQAMKEYDSNMGASLLLSRNVPRFQMKTYHNRGEMEDALRNETREKSLEEVIEIALDIYLQKECGAFDIVSIICEKDTFKPEWKQLFEREWSRREVRLMEHVEHEYFTGAETGYDSGYNSDISQPDPSKMLRRVRHLETHKDERQQQSNQD